MVKNYLKQAVELMRQNKLFTGIYVTGTALAVASTMIMAIIYYVKLAPMYPEVNRSDTYYLTMGRFENKHRGWTNSFSFSYKALQEWFYPLQNAEVVSAYYDDSFGESYYVQPADDSGDFIVNASFVDPAYFRLYQFQFTQGKPFTEEEFQSGQRHVVISDQFARRVFHTSDDVVGRTFSMNYVDYQVVGVVKEPSFLAKNTYAQVYAPFSTIPGYDRITNAPDYMGRYCVAILSKDGKTLRAEIEELARKYDQSQDNWRWILFNQPMSYYTTVFSPFASSSFSWGLILSLYLGIFIVLLLVPALNLSGMIAGRMETRLAEMGVRKSFGASRRLLLGQVMWENFFLTLVGAFLGLLIAWAALYGFRASLFTLLDQNTYSIAVIQSEELSPGMLFSPVVFAIALLVCLLLNLLSALIPAWNSLRHPIVESLNEKR